MPLAVGSAASWPFACATGRSCVRASASRYRSPSRCPSPTSLRSSGAVPGRPRSAASSTRAHQLPAVVSAPCVVSGLGRSTSTAPPAGTGFRQGGGALSSCGCVGGGGVRLGALSLPGTLRADQEPDGDASGGGSHCAGVEFRRLHPHQNPGTGDLPGKDRAPNLGPGLCACARPEYRVPLASADPVEFHPRTSCAPDHLHDQRTGDHQSSLTPHQFPGTHRAYQPLITLRTPTNTPPKRNST